MRSRPNPEVLDRAFLQAVCTRTGFLKKHGTGPFGFSDLRDAIRDAARRNRTLPRGGLANGAGVGLSVLLRQPHGFEGLSRRAGTSPDSTGSARVHEEESPDQDQRAGHEHQLPRQADDEDREHADQDEWKAHAVRWPRRPWRALLGERIAAAPAARGAFAHAPLATRARLLRHRNRLLATCPRSIPQAQESARASCSDSPTAWPGS